MEQKTLLPVLVLFLCFSHVLLSLGAVSLSRSGSFRSIDEEPSTQQLVYQGLTVPKTYGEELDEEGFVHGRMDAEIQDYPGSGANRLHNPNTPNAPGKT